MKLFQNKAKQHAIRMGQYVAIVNLLSEEFGWDEVVEKSAMQTLTNRDEKFDQTFEYIIDNPHRAQFRLRWSEEGLRVSYYPIMHAYSDQQHRADTLTEAIREIQNG